MMSFDLSSFYVLIKFQLSFIGFAFGTLQLVIRVCYYVNLK